MNWPSVALQDVCEINPWLSAEERPSSEVPVSFVPMSSVDEVLGEIVGLQHCEPRSLQGLPIGAETEIRVE